MMQLSESPSGAGHHARDSFHNKSLYGKTSLMIRQALDVKEMFLFAMQHGVYSCIIYIFSFPAINSQFNSSTSFKLS